LETEILRKVYAEYLDIYEEAYLFCQAFAPTGSYWVTNGDIEVKISAESVLPEGFLPGRLLRKWYTDGEKDVFLCNNEALPFGFQEGRSFVQGCNNPTHGKVWVTNGEENKLHEPGKRIPSGWRKGMTRLNPERFWINNGRNSKLHTSTEPIPTGWHKGRFMPWASRAGSSRPRR
jgi:hypothetical protein